MFWRKAPKMVKHEQESLPVQLRIIRSHIAAQADQLSTILTHLHGIAQRQIDAQTTKDDQ